MDDSHKDASDAPHPDSILRLASAVHRFSIPFINPEDQLSFEESFKSCSRGNPTTQAAIKEADVKRQAIKKCMADGKISHPALSNALVQYIPLINQILLSCKFQPEVARLDKRLVFSWESGIEYLKSSSSSKKKKHFDSEALMFELVLSLSAYALSESNVGCDSCIDGDFPNASRAFARAAGIFHYLGDDALPNWMANSKQHAEMERESLAETRVGVALAFATLYAAMAQQMAVATILVKPGAPNYFLVGKLCSGIADELDSFVSALRSKAAIHMQKMDPAFLTLMTFESNVQRSISLYFLARGLWSSCEYGVAISALSEATVAARTRGGPLGRGLPEIEAGGPLQSLVAEVNGFRMHMNSLLKAWEKDNSLVYFDKVPPSVPANKALKAINLKKMEEFQLEVRDPLPLGGTPGSPTNGSKGNGAAPPPSYDQAMVSDPRLAEGHRRSDSDLARELHEKLNA